MGTEILKLSSGKSVAQSEVFRRKGSQMPKFGVWKKGRKLGQEGTWGHGHEGLSGVVGMRACKGLFVGGMLHEDRA